MRRAVRFIAGFGWYAGVTLAALCVLAWGASYWRPMLEVPAPHYRYVYLGAGEMGLSDDPGTLPANLRLTINRWRGWTTFFWPQSGLHWTWGRASQCWSLPIWVPLTAGIVTAAVSLLARSRQARKPWQCQACGYDRRGLTSGAVCPECGGGP